MLCKTSLVSSSSNMISSFMVETSALKTMLGTTVKLNGSNYLLWAQVFVYLLALKQISSHPSRSICYYRSYLCDLTYWRLFCDDMLLNSLEEKINGSIIFLTTAKEMWDTLKVMYGNKKNPSRVFEIYQRLFELKQRDRSVPEFYDELKGLIDELEMHQPAMTDAATL